MSVATQASGISGEYTVTLPMAAEYREKGHVLLRGVASPEAAAHYKDAITSAVQRLNTERRPMEQRDTYGKAFLQTMNLWRNDAATTLNLDVKWSGEFFWQL